MTNGLTETFFLPEAIGCEQSCIPADIYNICHHLLTHSKQDYVFVPVRSLQVLAVVAHHEIVFVDSLSYACVDGEGGRIILVTWKMKRAQHCSTLKQPVDCEVTFHHEDGNTLQPRLAMEFLTALEQLDKKQREQTMPAKGARIVKF